MRLWIGIVTAALVLLAVGLAVADRLNLEWLKYATMVAVPFASAMLVVFGKRRRARLANSDSPDSIEAITDTTLRAAVFLDALLLTTLAVLVGAVIPEMPSWALPAALLAGLALDYWIRHAIAKPRSVDADC